MHYIILLCGFLLCIVTETCPICRKVNKKFEKCAQEVGPCEHIPTPCEEGIKYPDRGICDIYYQCIDGKLEGRQCQLGWIFNQITQTCSPGGPNDCNIVCPTLPPTTPVTPTQGTTTDSSTTQQQTTGGLRTGIAATAFKTTESPAGRDVFPCNIPQPCVEGALYGDPDNCQLYYQCGPGGLTVSRKPCHPGLYFDKRRSLCVDFHDGPVCELPCPPSCPCTCL